MSVKEKIHIIAGDIVESKSEAIVNAANTSLWMGSGVAGAIRKAGGPAIQKECDEIGAIALGEAAVTQAGDLAANYIIHAASMDFDTPTTEESLYDAVKNSLLRAEELKVASLAFPALGTGVGEFDAERCAEIMLGEMMVRLPQIPTLQHVEIILKDPEVYEVFKAEYDKL